MNRTAITLSIVVSILVSIFVLGCIIDNASKGDTNTNNHTLDIGEEKEIGTPRYGGYIENQSIVLHNNVWGLTNIEKNNNVVKSYIYYKYNGNFGWEWDRPNPRPSLDTYVPPIYPEVIVGNIPGFDNVSSSSPYFPIQFKDISFFTSEVEYRYTKPVTGSYNLAYDIYWVDPLHNENKKFNVMIWIYGRLNKDKAIKYVSDGINEYEYHYRAPTGDQYWPWYAFILKDQDSPQTYRKVDIKALLDQLPKGSIKGDWIVPGIELGNEVWKGSGRIEIYRYEINLNNNTIH